jgi:hypothetical protein
MAPLAEPEGALVVECFNFYGLTIAVHSATAAPVEEIRRDFAYFHVPQREALVQVHVHLRPPPYEHLPSARAFRFTLRSVCFRDGSTIYIDYFGQALAILDRQAQRCDVYGTNLDQVHEIVYLFMLSTVGHHLGGQGIHRVHALGVNYHQQGILLLLPSGGGKSTMALELLRHPEFFLLSEDTPLVDRQGMLLPFPLRLGVLAHRRTEIPAQHVRTVERMGLAPKTLIDIEYFRDRVGQPVEPRFLLVGERNLGDVSEITPLSRRRAFTALLSDLVIARGVYQGREFLGKQGSRESFDKGKVAFARLQNCVRLLSRVSSSRFTLGRNLDKNAQTLINFLHHAQ